MSVLIGIVTCNRRNLLEEALKSLEIQEYKDFDVLVINNNSTDGTKEFLDEYQKSNNIFVKNLKTNTGRSRWF